MQKKCPLCRGVLFAMVMAGTGAVSAQENSGRPIRIFTAAVSGGSDLIARMLAPEISGPLGQQVIVDNRGIIAAQLVAKAPADGDTLLLYGNTVWLLPLMRKTSWDPVRDFAPMTMAGSFPNILVVHPSVRVRSVAALVGLAKARPGVITYASAGMGSSAHLSAELFKAMAGVNMVHAPYKSSGPSIIALLGGEVEVTFAALAAVAPHLKSGKLQGLAVTSAKPSLLAPGMPTVAASGLPGYESSTDVGILAPAKVLATRINQLNREIVRVLTRTDIKEKFLRLGVEAVGSSSEDFAGKIQSDIAKWGKVIRDAGIRDE